MRFIDTKSYFVSEASVSRLLKAHDLITSPAHIVIKAGEEFQNKTTAPNQMWQTDFTYLKVIGWGWFYLSTILDDYSRYIVSWKLCTDMKVADVTSTVGMALDASHSGGGRPEEKLRLLSDNGGAYIAGDLADWLEERGVEQIHGAPGHPQTQGKIERWHQTLKNRILLENYYFPGQLEEAIAAFVEHYKSRSNDGMNEGDYDFTYDYAGRLLTAVNFASVAGRDQSFSYDAAGRMRSNSLVGTYSYGTVRGVTGTDGQPDWFEVAKLEVGTNRYAYAANDPVNLRDPGGNETVFVGGAGDNEEHKDDPTEIIRDFGVENPRTSNPSVTVGVFDSNGNMGLGNMVMDAIAAIAMNHDMIHEGGSSIIMKDAQLSPKHSFDQQYTLVGYPWGAVTVAHQAITEANSGVTVDNVVLIGAPLNESMME